MCEMVLLRVLTPKLTAPGVVEIPIKGPLINIIDL